MNNSSLANISASTVVSSSSVPNMADPSLPPPPSSPPPCSNSIQSLTITNFKSYIGTTTISPFYRFTSVIGPNASGKSNLLDALLFVLNIPNSHLRISNISSLVSSGQSHSSVALLFDNTLFMRSIFIKHKSSINFDTINTSSCINSSADCSSITKYKINSENVTHKEYEQHIENRPLLYYSRYLILTQSAAPSSINFMDLLEIFSGSHRLIPRYEQLEREYQAKTKELTGMLENKRILMNEIKAISANEEARKEYCKLNENKEILEEQIRIKEINEKTGKIDQINKIIAELEEEKQTDGYEIEKRVIDELRSEAARWQKEWLESETNNYKKRIKLESDKIKYEELMRDYEEMHKSRRALQNELSKYSSINNSSQLGSTAAFNSDSTAAFNSDSTAAFNSDNTAAFSALEILFKESVRDEEMRLSKLIMDNYDNITIYSQLTKTIKQLNDKLNKIKETNRQIKIKNEQEQYMLNKIDNEIEELTNKISANENAYNQINDALKNKQNELISITNDILISKSIKSNQKKYTIVNQIYATLKQLQSGVHGKLTDLIKPTQQRYEQAVSAILSAYDLALVVDNNSTAIECIRYAKATGIRITLLINKPVGQALIDQSDQTQAKIDQTLNASDQSDQTLLALKRCINYESKYEGIVRMIIKDTVIVENINKAKEVLYSNANKTGGINTCVTLDGIVMDRNGIIIKRETYNYKADELLEKRIQINKEIKEMEIKLKEYEEVKKVKEKIKEKEREREEIKRKDEEENEEEIEREIKEKEKRKKEVESELKEYNREEGEIKRKIKEKEREIMKEILEREGVETVAEYKRKEMMKRREREIEEEIKQMEERINEKDKMANNSNNNIVANNTADSTTLDASLELAKHRLRERMKVFEIIASRRREIERIGIEQAINKMKIEEEINGIRRCMEKTSEVDELRETSKEELQRELQKVESKLNAYGSITVHGGGRTNKLCKQFNELNTECDKKRKETDKARDKFITVKKERMLRFSKLFNQIGTELGICYAKLVGNRDRNADNTQKYETHLMAAHLMAEGDPFVNGLKYFLMPHGKAFTEFKDLSGGEQTIALLAFVFTIGQHAGVPFFLLDEVDAALDRVHVEKLARFIDEAKQQFIVVSLKPQLFQQSDALIGVYRERDGPNNSSKILTYRLK